MLNWFKRLFSKKPTTLICAECGDEVAINAVGYCRYYACPHKMITFQKDASKSTVTNNNITKRKETTGSNEYNSTTNNTYRDSDWVIPVLGATAATSVFDQSTNSSSSCSSDYSGSSSSSSSYSDSGSSSSSGGSYD